MFQPEYVPISVLLIYLRVLIDIDPIDPQLLKHITMSYGFRLIELEYGHLLREEVPGGRSQGLLDVLLLVETVVQREVKGTLEGDNVMGLRGQMVVCLS